jgi:hypothetical protein
MPNSKDHDMNTMNITSAKYVNYMGQPSSISATIDGQEWSVPLTPGNRHYQMVLEAIADGQPVLDPPAPTEEQQPDLSFAQLMIGLVSEGWITTAEGEAWLTGTLPAPVLTLIGTLPTGQQFAAKARALRPTIVERTDPLVSALGAAQKKTPEQLDDFFRTYAAI